MHRRLEKKYYVLVIERESDEGDEYLRLIQPVIIYPSGMSVLNYVSLD